jgi:hypothetical protein
MRHEISDLLLDLRPSCVLTLDREHEEPIECQSIAHQLNRKAEVQFDLAKR